MVVERTIRGVGLLSITTAAAVGLGTHPTLAAGIQKLAEFNGTNGFQPIGSLTLGSNGLFYGTAASGGS